MPKLSQQTLEKRFSCPHCGQKIRTRQGLLGHIQFKHASGAIKKEKSLIDLVTDIKIKEKFLRSIGLGEQEISELTQVRREWVYVKTLMEDKDCKVSDADFKTYQIVAYALMASDKRFKNWLTGELNTAIAKLMELNLEITANRLQKRE